MAEANTVKLYYTGTMEKSFPVKKGGERLGKIRPGVEGATFVEVSEADAAWLEQYQPGLWSRFAPAPVEAAVEAEQTPVPVVPASKRLRLTDDPPKEG